MDSAVRETPSWVRASARSEVIPRAVSPVVAATSICLRVGDWASVARLLASFMFPSEIHTFTHPCALHTAHVWKPKTKICSRQYFASSLPFEAYLLTFTFEESLCLIPLSTAFVIWESARSVLHNRTLNRLVIRCCKQKALEGEILEGFSKIVVS